MEELTNILACDEGSSVSDMIMLRNPTYCAATFWIPGGAAEIMTVNTRVTLKITLQRGYRIFHEFSEGAKNDRDYL